MPLQLCYSLTKLTVIMQWVVLAIRNLCENNLENQAVIASMTRKGTVDSSVLLEIGLTLHTSDENKIIVMPRDGMSSL
jgi:ataxin-10